MPSLGSGEIFGGKKVPNGVGNGRPPPSRKGSCCPGAHVAGLAAASEKDQTTGVGIARRRHGRGRLGVDRGRRRQFPSDQPRQKESERDADITRSHGELVRTASDAASRRRRVRTGFRMSVLLRPIFLVASAAILQYARHGRLETRLVDDRGRRGSDVFAEFLETRLEVALVFPDCGQRVGVAGLAVVGEQRRRLCRRVAVDSPGRT